MRVGVGIEDGRALIVKVGYSGNGIYGIAHMGDVANRAAKLTPEGSEAVGTPPMMIGDDFAFYLNEDSKNLINKDFSRDCQSANVINVPMNYWREESCI